MWSWVENKFCIFLQNSISITDTVLNASEVQKLQKIFIATKKGRNSLLCWQFNSKVSYAYSVVILHWEEICGKTANTNFLRLMISNEMRILEGMVSDEKNVKVNGYY